MSSVPADLLYSTEHEWVAGDAEPGSVVTIGITEHAATLLATSSSSSCPLWATR